MSITAAWFARSRSRVRPLYEARHLIHPPAMLIVGVIGFVFFAGLVVVSNIFSNPTTTWWTTTAFSGFALLSLTSVSAFFLEEYDVSDDGLRGRNFAGIRKSVLWRDLRNVRYAASMKWFRLETQSGCVARIPVTFMGLPEFARTLLQNAPQGVIDPPALNVLQATASGNPPSLWV